MSGDGRLSRDVTDRQVAMFRMFVGPNLFTTRAALHAASGIPDSTLKSWAAGAAMPFHGALALARYLPREALNMMAEPGGLHLVDIETVRTNWDAVAADAAGLVSQVCEARSDGHIDHVEDAQLRQRARRMAAEFSAIAEEG